MLPLQKIVQATPPKIRQRARQQCYGLAYAAPRSAKGKGVTKSGGYVVEDESGKYREFKFRVKATDGWRKVAVRFYGPLNPATRVWCWCSCPYFKYHCEVALAHKGSSSVVQSNGQRPRFTNPKMHPRVCKHVFYAFMLAVRRRPPDKADEKGQIKKGVDKKMVKARVEDAFRWAGDVVANTVAGQGYKPPG
jgi:hypothetical protein